MTDLIENLISDWGKERTDIDARPMAVVGRILRLGRSYENSTIEALKPYKLKYTEFDVLATLRRKGQPFQLNPKQLMKSVLITSGAMTACLDRLENRELIKRIQDPNDRRGTLIVLASKGITLVDKAIATRFTLAKCELQILSKNEQNELAKLLTRLSTEAE